MAILLLLRATTYYYYKLQKSAFCSIADSGFQRSLPCLEIPLNLKEKAMAARLTKLGHVVLFYQPDLLATKN
jgi:hypothetical protein